MKSYTDFEQSKKLGEILPLDTADQTYERWVIAGANLGVSEEMLYRHNGDIPFLFCNGIGIPCWSLAALLNILHSKAKDIPSLSGGGYKDGKYISDWCLDYEFENGDYQKTFAENPVDACYEMIIRLHELNLL